jgi:hypothetical protein
LVGRQVQAIEEKVGGFIPRIVRPVAEKYAGFVEAADGKAHQVAEGRQLLAILVVEVGGHVKVPRRDEMGWEDGLGQIDLEQIDLMMPLCSYGHCEQAQGNRAMLVPCDP